MEQYIRRTHEFTCKLRMELTQKRGASKAQLQKIASEPDMQPRDKLNEEIKEGYRIRLRMLAENMEDFPSRLDCGLPPKTWKTP